MGNWAQKKGLIQKFGPGEEMRLQSTERGAEECKIWNAKSRRSPKSSAARWWTPRPRGTQGQKTRAPGPEPRLRPQPGQARPSNLGPGRPPHSHCPVPEALQHGQRGMVATILQQLVDHLEQDSKLRRGCHGASGPGFGAPGRIRTDSSQVRAAQPTESGGWLPAPPIAAPIGY